MKNTFKNCAIFGLVTVPTIIISTAIGLTIVDSFSENCGKIGKKVKEVRNKFSIMIGRV